MSTESILSLSDQGIINDLREGDSAEVTQRKQGTFGLSVAGIVLLVLSILVFLVGFCLLIPGIVQATPLLMATGAGLIGVGFLGLLIAGIFIVQAWHKGYQFLEKECSRLSGKNEVLEISIDSTSRWAERTNEELLESKKLLLEKEQKIAELETIVLEKQEALQKERKPELRIRRSSI